MHSGDDDDASAHAATHHLALTRTDTKRLEGTGINTHDEHGRTESQRQFWISSGVRS
ncbi:hypothetical protein GCM10010384_41160 [Streptomyces djakartensis]|uniref:Uncharacterized protein n=1 Tax=Streptomyces djakartensis TaxID=68193 RepID=A0ABQ2ZYF6_9ACTN|nr:hypothetical protein GCM10010384_41160 [Streptomyces djakartensis]